MMPLVYPKHPFYITCEEHRTYLNRKLEAEDFSGGSGDAILPCTPVSLLLLLPPPFHQMLKV